MERMNATKSRAVNLCKSVVISYLVTLFLLLLVSFIMLQTGMSGTLVSAAIIITYIVSAFSGSFFMGRHVEQKRYLWGLFAALLYYVVYLVISLIIKGDHGAIDLLDYVKSFVIVVCSGMIGGMLS